ncbi:MAG: GNAT family N-acetyltransferase [Chthoniobacterales bacterium]|jgi:putative acetyltransferase|nr:GNAT family N-acetyltransferase [Chthoniobacterales bacterium]
MKIELDDLTGPAIAQCLDEHIQDMRSVSPPESKHALDLEGLRSKDISFWSVYDGNELVGCGALKEIDATHGEIKSMRTAKTRRGQGIGALILNHIIKTANERGYLRLSLETGSMDFFLPARFLYEKMGFGYCAPFGSYREDPNSVFMHLELKKPNKTAHPTADNVLL